MISLPNLILLNIRILANGEGIFNILKLRLVSVICDREVQAKRKPRNRCGFWVLQFVIKREISAWSAGLLSEKC